jgi:hypothetical protein
MSAKEGRLMLLKRITSLALCLTLLLPAPVARAGSASGGLSLSQEISAAGSGSEYVSGNYPGAILMPVNLWGSISKPGIHHVPTRTDLVTLLSLAGGPSSDARLDDIVIKRRNGKEELIIKVDAEEVLTEAGVQSPVLEANDIIIIPREKPVIGSNTVTVVGFAASILGLVLAGFALSNQLKN